MAMVPSPSFLYRYFAFFSDLFVYHIFADLQPFRHGQISLFRFFCFSHFFPLFFYLSFSWPPFRDESLNRNHNL